MKSLSFLQLTYFPQYSTFKVKIRVFWNVFSHLCLKSIQKNFQKLVWYSFFSFRVKIELLLMAMRNFYTEIYEFFLVKFLFWDLSGYDLDTVVYTYSNTFFLLVFSESFGGFLVEVLLMFWKMSNCYWSDSQFRWRRESSQNIPPGWILTTNI